MTNYILAKNLVPVVLDTTISDTEGLIVGVAGNVNVVMATPGVLAPAAITVPVIAGYNPLSVRRVNTAGTTATGLFAVY